MFGGNHMTTDERKERLNWPDMSADNQAMELAKLVLNGTESEPKYVNRLLQRAQEIKEQLLSGELVVEETK
jgi:hypothetical protein